MVRVGDRVVFIPMEKVGGTKRGWSVGAVVEVHQGRSEDIVGVVDHCGQVYQVYERFVRVVLGKKCGV